MGALDGQVAVITGGGRGQGRAHAVTLAREGADIVVCDINAQLPTVPYSMNAPGDLEETARQVRALGRECLAQEADVRDSAAVEALFAAAIEKFGHVDILCANAGVYGFAEVADTSDELWKDTLDVNLTGAFYSLREAAKLMRAQRSGRVVLTSSMCGRQATANMSAYVATKWAVIGLAKTAALELAPYEVRVNAVCPTFVDTPMLNHDVYNRLFRPDLEAPTRADAEEVVRELHKLPVGSYPPEEVSAAVLFLVTDQSRYITGTALDISAGKGTEWSA